MVVLVAIGAALAAVVVLAVTRRWRRRVTARRIEALLAAAVAGDRAALERAGAKATALRDRDGNTALHLAYYRAERDAVAALVAFGADDNLRNKEGLSPAQLGEVAAIEQLLGDAAACLTPAGEWIDSDRGRRLYDRLVGQRPKVYNPALVRRAIGGSDGPQLLYLAIKVGVRGSEQKLAEVLHGYGTKRMAEDYLNCGSPTLRAAAELWARRRRYRIYYTGGVHPVSWGRF
jgi:hypothetical protein